MSDILDSIDDLIDDDYDTEDDFSSADGDFTEMDTFSDDLQEVIETESDMSENEAREITEAIRSAATATYILLAQAHEGKAYKALGYDTWASYVKEEFEISPQRSYQLLDLSKVIKMIEGSAPEGTDVRLTEAQARDIKRELPKITERIQEETKDMSPTEARETIDSIIDDTRDEVAEQKKYDDDAVAKQQKALDEADEEGYHRALEDVADQMLEADATTRLDDGADDELIEVEVAGDGDGHSPEDAMNLYNFVNALSTFESLPEPDDFVNVIPDSRFSEVYEQVMDMASWVNRLSTLMDMRKGGDES